MKKKIKFVYFDVGGVVIKDFSGTNKWQDLKQELGIKPQDDVKFDSFYDSLAQDRNTFLDINLLIPQIRKDFNILLPDNYDFLDGFVKRFEKNESIWPIIAKAMREYRIGLLTNMYPNMLDSIKTRKLLPEVEWDIVIDSSIALVCKPQKEIFDLARSEANVDHTEILFIDNTKKNIEAANKLGWKTFLYDPTNILESNKNLSTLLELSN